MLAIERLYEACRTAFSGGNVPTAANLQHIYSVLDKVRPSDVGLNENGDSENPRGFGFFGNRGRRGRHSNLSLRWAPPITYLHLYECKDFSMGIFCLPATASIPLHNHPGMVVMSKLLYGSMHVRAFDWIDPFDEKLNANPATPRLAKLVEDRVLTAPCHTETLFPTHGGNIHAFTALSSCAVLDVLAPPYDASSGRHCTYYHDLPKAPAIVPYGNGREVDEKEKQKYAWLEEFQPPDDFVVQRGHYTGPPVCPKN